MPLSHPPNFSFAMHVSWQVFLVFLTLCVCVCTCLSLSLSLSLCSLPSLSRLPLPSAVSQVWRKALSQHREGRRRPRRVGGEIKDLGKSLQHPLPTHGNASPGASSGWVHWGALPGTPTSRTSSLRCQGPLTTAAVALMEGEIGAGKIVDKLILPNEESALGGNGIIDGGSKTGLRAVEGAYPATVDVQLQGSRVSGFSPHVLPCGQASAWTTAWDGHTQLPPGHRPRSP